MVENLVRILRRAGHRCLSTTDPERALTLLESERLDLVLTDLKMPAVDGLAVLRRAHEIDPGLPVVVITAFATIESAVAAIKQGAFDYLPKNFSVDQLTVVVERALRQRRLSQENRNLREQLQTVLGPSPRARGNQVSSPDDQYSPDITGVFVRGTVSIIQPIFTWGLVENARLAAEHGVKAAQAGVDVKNTEVALRVKSHLGEDADAQAELDVGLDHIGVLGA